MGMAVFHAIVANGPLWVAKKGRKCPPPCGKLIDTCVRPDSKD